MRARAAGCRGRVRRSPRCARRRAGRSAATRRPRRSSAPSGSAALSALTQMPATFSFSRTRIDWVGPLTTTTMSVGLSSSGSAPAGIEDRAEQQQFGAGEAVGDLDLALRHVGHQHRLARLPPISSGASSEQRQRALHEQLDRVDFVGPPAEPERHAERDQQHDHREQQAQIFGLHLAARTARRPARRSPSRAAAAPASTMSTALVVVAWTIVVAGGDEQDLEQRGADHDLRRHAEQIDHRRHQDEAAADAEQHRQDAGRRSRAAAARAARCRGPSDRSASAAAAPRPADGGAACAARGGCAARASRGSHWIASLRHQRRRSSRAAGRRGSRSPYRSGRSPGAAGTAARRRSEPSTPPATSTAAHLEVDAAAPAVREHARDAGAGHLARGGGGGDGRRDAVEDQQRRGQEAAADAEHARQQPDARRRAATMTSALTDRLAMGR